MAPPLTILEDGREGERQKHSRKMKRLRDASCLRKRETKQDRWGRQRGGRKARWDKLDRQPSALKSRLRSVNSVRADTQLDTEDALSFADALLARGSRGIYGQEGATADADGDGDDGNGRSDDAASELALTRVGVDQGGEWDHGGGAPHTPSAKKQQQQKKTGMAPQGVEDDDSVGWSHDDIRGHHNAGGVTTTPEPPSLVEGADQGSGGSSSSGRGAWSKANGGIPASRGSGGGSNARQSSLRSPGGIGGRSRPGLGSFWG